MVQLQNRILAQRKIAPFADNDVCCQRTSICCVDSIFETLGPLCHGRPLLAVSNTASADADQLTSIIERVAYHPFGDGTLIGDDAAE
jgi:hypothetical protein